MRLGEFYSFLLLGLVCYAVGRLFFEGYFIFRFLWFVFFYNFLVNFFLGKDFLRFYWGSWLLTSLIYGFIFFRGRRRVNFIGIEDLGIYDLIYISVGYFYCLFI